MATPRSIPDRRVNLNSLGNIIFSLALSFALTHVVNTGTIRRSLPVGTRNISNSTQWSLSTSQDETTRHNRSNDSPMPLLDLPMGWGPLCTRKEMFVDWNFSTLTPTEVRNMVQISCHLRNSDSISFIDFRKWSEKQNATKLAIKVVCDSSEGSFYLPWPMKAKNLVFIKVQRCKLNEYYSEYFSTNITEIPDEIRVMELDSTIAMINLLELGRTIMEIAGLSTDVSCGPLTLEKQVFTNCSNDLEDNEYVDEDYTDLGNDSSATETFDLDETADLFWSGFRNLNAKCNYRNMRYFADNHKKNVAGVYMRLLLEQSIYPKLQSFDLSHNGFRIVPEELQKWRGEFPKLDYLDLSHNNISRIFFLEKSFAVDGIGKINLQYNNITTVTASDILTLNDLESAVVDFSNNPINCSCGAIKDLYEFQAIPDLGEYEYVRDLVCQSPVSRIGKKIRDLTQEEIICQTELPKVHIVLVVILSAVVVVLGITVLVLLRYRREVVILVYTRLHIVLPCQPVDSYEGKNYDAFISYSSKDDNWVLRTLVQRLENNEKGERFKLCVHHRDFEIGAAIADNVVQSVESSRHTVMVLSRNYVESEWCIYEFRTAMHQSLIEKRKHLIVILLEDVPKSELDADLRKCLETFTYIQVGDKLFWDKILYSLGHRNKPKSSNGSSQSITESERTPESGKDKLSSKDIHVSMLSVV